MNTHHVKVYRRSDGCDWEFDHAIAGSECDSLSAASIMANGYNCGTVGDTEDPDWPFLAVATPIEEAPKQRRNAA